MSKFRARPPAVPVSSPAPSRFSDRSFHARRSQIVIPPPFTIWPAIMADFRMSVRDSLRNTAGSAHLFRGVDAEQTETNGENRGDRPHQRQPGLRRPSVVSVNKT